MLRFGFELEGFFIGEGGETDITIPPKTYPTDGFPGLVEFRSSGGQDLYDAFADVLVQVVKHPNVITSECEHIFSPRDRMELRRRHEVKSAWDIQNLYGKYPRALGNKTIASVQINISNLLRKSRTDDKGVFHADDFGLLDIPRIVRALDEEFSAEIKEARRQPGEYCVKDDVRLEYRSLPNFVFPSNPRAAKEFLSRIEACTK